MKKIVVSVLMAGVLTFAGAWLASAQSDPAFVKIPFQFIVSGKVLPAGSYRIASQDGSPSLLMITGIDQKGAAAFTETEWAGGSDAVSGSVHVSFTNIDGHYFLSQVSMPGRDTRLIPLTKSSAEQLLVRLNLMSAGHGDAATK